MGAPEWIVVILGATSLAYLWIKAREGRVRVTGDRPRLSSRDLGSARGARATLVQFSTDTCSKCPPTAAMARQMAESVPGVRHVEIDAVARLGLARRVDVLRTPTILVLDEDGFEVARISGATSEARLREALDLAPPPTT